MYRSTNDFKVIAIILLDGLEYKIKKLYSDIGNWAYALTVASGELHNANMIQAKKLYEKQFLKQAILQNINVYIAKVKSPNSSINLLLGVN